MPSREQEQYEAAYSTRRMQQLAAQTPQPPRSHVIGGTDAASLIGLGRVSPTILYLRLRGEVADDFAGNEATEAGTLFEDGMVAPLAHRHFGMTLLRPASRTMVLPDEPRIGASFDFVVSGTPDFADAKATGSHKWEHGEALPLHVAAQMQMQMAVARAAGRVVPCVHVLAMFFPGFMLRDFPVEEDRSVGDALLQRAREMIARVDRGEPPVPGDEADARALFLGRRGVIHIATVEQVALLEQLRIAKTAEKEVATQIKQIRDALVPAFGDATEIVHPGTGEVLATYRPNRLFDAGAFTAAHPDIVAKFQRFDRAAAEKADSSVKRLAEKFMREPTTASESVRALKIIGGDA